MNKYTPSQIDKMLKSMTVIYDTREHEGESLTMRLEGLNRPYRRECLKWGDYTGEYTGIDSEVCSMAEIAVVERKMSLTEIAGNFTSGRERFRREFERAKEAGCHVHVLVENDNYEKMRNGKYKSQLNPQAFIASWLSWSLKYNLQPHFCKSESAGWLISNILHYELRNYLLNQ